MSNVLLISDDDRRARRLASNIDSSAEVYVYDFYDERQPPDSAKLIIVDVDSLNSSTISRMISLLRRVRGNDVPLLFLAHGNSARGRIQAELIGATETVPAASSLRQLSEAVSKINSPDVTAPTSAAVKLAAEARQFLIEVFFSGAKVNLQLATTGSDLIAHAVAESGIRNWVSAVQQFDNATHQHCLLVAGLGATFATSLGLGRAESFRLTKAALLHDVGKTEIPLSILNKPGRLTREEIAVVRTHALKGYEMLKDHNFSLETLLVVRSHHEMLDGSGYPDGLRENEIRDLVRLVTICDIFGALIERRSYKPPLPASEAYSIIAGMKGRLDMSLVAAFRPVADSVS